MMRRRGWLQGKIEGLHKKTDSYDNTKVAWFFNNVVSAKNTEKVVEKITCYNEEDVEHVTSKAFQHVHVSFWSTSSFNINTINTLNNCKLSDIIRTRGQCDNMRYWGIEMNEARQLYIGTYSHIDFIDHIIKNCRMKCRCWKY